MGRQIPPGPWRPVPWPRWHLQQNHGLMYLRIPNGLDFTQTTLCLITDAVCRRSCRATVIATAAAAVRARRARLARIRVRTARRRRKEHFTPPSTQALQMGLMVNGICMRTLPAQRGDRTARGWRRQMEHSLRKKRRGSHGQRMVMAGSRIETTSATATTIAIASKRVFPKTRKTSSGLTTEGKMMKVKERREKSGEKSGKKKTVSNHARCQVGVDTSTPSCERRASGMCVVTAQSPVLSHTSKGTVCVKGCMLVQTIKTPLLGAAGRRNMRAAWKTHFLSSEIFMMAAIRDTNEITWEQKKLASLFYIELSMHKQRQTSSQHCNSVHSHLRPVPKLRFQGAPCARPPARRPCRGCQSRRLPWPRSARSGRSACP